MAPEFSDPPDLTMVSCLAYSSTLKIKTLSFETSVDFEWTTRRIAGDKTLHNHRRTSESQHLFCGK
jgi:hypothetical protein